MATVASPHVWLDDRGIAWIDDTNVKVLEVALDKLAHGWSAEEIHDQHYRELSMAQIHAALTYFYDHRVAFDAQIEGQLQEYEDLRMKSLDSPGRQRLRAAGKLS